MKGKIIKAICIATVFTVTALLLPGCTGKNGEQGKTKIKVEVFDRNNAPEGQGSATDNKWTKWINSQVAKIGLEVEFMACPRAQEKEKLNVWMASSSAPDIVFTYDYNLVASYAEQGGIYELGGLIAKHGKAIQDMLKDVLPYGKYKGKQFSIPGKAQVPAAAPLKIRQDWLDKLGMPMPQNIDQLYATLKAFKEKDPGGVGKENVVPFAIPAPGVVGTPGSYMDLMFPFGVRNDIIGSFPAMPSGNYENGVFKSPVDLPAAKEFYRWMNKLYKEGLIHKEFAVDNNGARYNQHVSSGVAGFVDCNAPDIDPLTVKAVPTVNWAIMPPLADANGNRMVALSSPARWFNMIPKASKVPEAAIKYINWMLSEKVDITLYNGLEGVNWDMKDGVVMVKDKAFNQKDVDWIGQDLNLVGFASYTVPKDKREIVYNDKSGKKQLQAFDIAEKYGKLGVVLDAPRKVAQDRMSQLQKHLFEGAAKVILASDFEKEYAAYVDGWNKLGGADYDKEITDILNSRNK